MPSPSRRFGDGPNPLTEALKEVITKVLERQERLVVILLYYEKMTPDEVMAILDISRVTLAARLSSAISKFQKAKVEMS